MISGFMVIKEACFVLMDYKKSPFPNWPLKCDNIHTNYLTMNMLWIKFGYTNS